MKNICSSACILSAVLPCAADGGGGGVGDVVVVIDLARNMTVSLLIALKMSENYC